MTDQDLKLTQEEKKLYEADDPDVFMSKLLETRDATLEHIRSCVTTQKMKGSSAHLEILTRVCKLIEVEKERVDPSTKKFELQWVKPEVLKEDPEEDLEDLES